VGLPPHVLHLRRRLHTATPTLMEAAVRVRRWMGGLQAVRKLRGIRENAPGRTSGDSVARPKDPRNFDAIFRAASRQQLTSLGQLAEDRALDRRTRPSTGGNTCVVSSLAGRRLQWRWHS
jgi:hypothetical protein